MAISTSAPEVEGVCANCTFDDYLSAEIKKTGTSLKCVGCEKKRKSILLSELAKKVEELIHKHYQRYSGGSELNSIVQDVASVEPEVADRIIQLLLPSKEMLHEAMKDGEDLLIEEGATYEECPAYTGDFQQHWDSFCYNVKHSARFFSKPAEFRLQEILEGIQNFKTPGPHGKPCVRTISPGEPEATLYRARKALGHAPIIRVIDNPIIEMGPPPGSQARAGRMNPAGVSVFYGSFDERTCIAEIRLPVGETDETSNAVNEGVDLDSDGLRIHETKGSDMRKEDVHDPLFVSPGDFDDLDPSKFPDVKVEPTLKLIEGSLRFWKVESTEQHVKSLPITDMREKDSSPKS